MSAEVKLRTAFSEDESPSKGMKNHKFKFLQSLQVPLRVEKKIGKMLFFLPNRDIFGKNNPSKGRDKGC